MENHKFNYVGANEILITEECKIKNNYTWASQIWEFDSIQFFYDKIKKNNYEHIVDIGAQSGSFCLMAKFLPETTWYSFEPDPINYKLLQDNIAINNITNVKTSMVALSDSIRVDTLNVNPNSRGLNTLGKKLIRFSENENQKVETQVNTLDSLFENQKIDMIKIDTEGAEYDILKGGENVIKKYKPAILLEYVEINLNQCGKRFADLHQMIDSLGYKISLSLQENILIEPK